MKYKKAQAAGAAIVLSMALMVGNAQAESLKSAVRAALRSHPEIAALAYNRKAVGEELAAAKGLWKPTIDVTAGAGGYINRFTTQEKYEISGVISQPIFDGGRGKYAVKRQRERVKSARNRVADTANAIALRVAQAYTEVQRSHAIAAAAHRNLRNLNNIAYLVNRRASGGKGNRAETAQARARIAAARAALAEARQRVRDAYALYITVVGHRPRKLTTGAPRLSRMPRSLSTAISRARSHSPKILALRHDALAAKAAIGGAESILMPKLNLEVSGRFANELKGTAAKDAHAQALVVLKWNLYNGGINNARVREAKYRASESQALRQVAGLNIEREVRLSWSAMLAARDRAGYLRRQLSANRSALAVQKRQFEVGKRTLLDILDTQNEVFTAETALKTEIFVARYNTYRILAAMGQLVPSLNIALPSAAQD
jgi:adhesin transport system outer membrane protein